MLFLDLPTHMLLLLIIPAFVNLWAIWHAMRHQFASEKEKFFWVLASVFIPFVGGLIYLIFGVRRCQKNFNLEKEYKDEKNNF